MKERFGDKADDVAYGDLPEDIKKELGDTSIKEFYKKCVVFERWDKERGKVYWFTKGLKGQFLDVQDDPLHLKDFFPCPAPLYATLTNGCLIPTPDYRLYRKLADDLDYITKRKSSLIEMVRCISAHDASMNDVMIRLKDMDDGDSVPIKNWVAFAEKGGLKAAMQFFPLDVVAQTVNLLTEAQADLIQKIYEITGMSDIVRGASDPNETATAQQIKGNWVTLRLSKNQADVQRFITELIQRKAEIIFAVVDGEPLFDDQMIMNMVGFESFAEEDKQLFPEALQLLRSDKMRTFKIDIETDSFLAIDEQMDKEAANEFMGAFGNMLNQSFSMVQAEPAMLPLMLEVTKFVARRYRTGKMVEAMIDKTFDTLLAKQQEAEANPPPEQPDPEMMKAQAYAQTEQMKMQIEQQKAQNSMQIEQALAQHKQQLEIFQAQSQLQMKGEKTQADIAIKGQKMQTDAQLKAQEMALGEQNNARESIKNEAFAPQSGQPLVLNVNISGNSKKVARFQTDPLTGDRIATVEDMPDIGISE
jgi:hypothetical protein